MSTFPKISIIIPTFNSATTLEACFESVVNQTYENKEVIVVDGLSSDSTVDIIKNYATEYPFINWISEKDKGIYDAMNKGIEMATGEWLYFLGSDDRLFDEKVFERVFVWNQKTTSESELIYGRFIAGDYGIADGSEITLGDLYNWNICHQTVFYSKKIFEKFGMYNPEHKVFADWELNMKVFADAKVKKRFYNCIICYFSLDGFHSNHIDPFFLNKDKIFKCLIRGQGVLGYVDYVLKRKYKGKITKRISAFANNLLSTLDSFRTGQILKKI